MKPKAWPTRTHWGIAFHGSTDERPMLLGEAWLDREAYHALVNAHPAAPTRPLLFTTRRAARDWCGSQHASYAEYPDGRVCRAWRFRPVRVRESWGVV